MWPLCFTLPGATGAPPDSSPSGPSCVFHPLTEIEFADLTLNPYISFCLRPIGYHCVFADEPGAGFILPRPLIIFLYIWDILIHEIYITSAPGLCSAPDASRLVCWKSRFRNDPRYDAETVDLSESDPTIPIIVGRRRAICNYSRICTFTWADFFFSY